MLKLPFKDQNLLSQISNYCRPKHFNDGEIIMEAGNEVVFIPLVMEGSIRVLRENEEGKEVFLYHLLPGQTCAMSLNCCQARKRSQVKAVAENKTNVLMVPADMVDDWFRFPEWKNYINNTYAIRFAELMNVIDLIAFNNMDAQLLNYLSKRAEVLNTKALAITHQQIADELHTHREAISRLLRQMEQKNLVKLGRNVIELLV